MKRTRLVLTVAAAFCATVPGPLGAEQRSLGAAQVRAELRAAASARRPPNFAHDRIFDQRLDGLDFRRADFRGADLLETSFRGAKLAGADFTRANMSAVKLANADARGANLAGATLLTTAENVDLRGANLTNASGYLIAPGGNLRGANLRGARLSPEMSNQPMGLLHTVLTQARLDGANLAHANLSFANLANASLRGADLRGTNFDEADLSRVDFSGADVTGADFTKADVTGARFVHVRGRSAMRGLATALGVEQATFR